MREESSGCSHHRGLAAPDDRERLAGRPRNRGRADGSHRTRPSDDGGGDLAGGECFLSQDILGQDGGANQFILEVWGATNLKVRTALDLASEGIGERFRGRPLVEAAIRLTIGEAYRGIGLLDQARPHLERAIELRSWQLGPNDPQTLIAKCRLGLLLLEDQPKLAEAEPLLVPALEGLLASRGIDDPETLIAMMGMGMLHAAKDDLPGGRELLAQAVEGLRVVRGPAHLETLNAIRHLVTVLQGQKQIGEARRLQRESIRLLDEPIGKERRPTLDAKFRLAYGFLGPGDYSASIPYLEDLLPVQRRALGDGHHSTLLTITMLAHCYLNTDRRDRAGPLLLEVLAQCRKAFDRNHELTLLVLADLSDYYSRKGDNERALPYLLEAVDIARALYGAEGGLTAGGNSAVARLYLKTPEHAAERYLRESLAYLVREAPDTAERYITEGNVGFCLLYRKARAEGEKKLQLAYEWVVLRYHELEPTPQLGFRRFMSRVMQYYDDTGNKEQAELWRVRRMDLEFPPADEVFVPGRNDRRADAARASG